MVHDYFGTIERESLTWIDAMDRHPLIGSIIRGDASRDQYIGFLGSTYHYIQWSAPLLAETAQGLRRCGRHPWLLQLLDAKTDEESPHDRWVLNDLKKIGGDVKLVTTMAAPPAVLAYVKWSRTMAREGSPAFLGAAYSLEIISMHRATMAAQNLIARRAIPNIESAVTFLGGHGDADVDHVALLADTLRRIEDPHDQAAIARSAAVVRVLYPLFFHSGGRAAATASAAVAAAMAS